MSLNRKRILIVGGAGFIGSWLVDEVAKYEVERVVVVDDYSVGKEENLENAKNRLRNKISVHKKDARVLGDLKNTILDEYPIDVVFNLGVKPLLHSFVDPVDAFDTSVKIVQNLLELQRNDYFTTLIHFSSSEAYGSAQYIPMDEKHPLNPTTAYGAGKAAADLLVLSYYLTYGLDVAIIRPFNNFGPRQNEKTYAGVIPTTILRVLRGTPPIIFGDGKQTRDYIYVSDTVKAAIKIYETAAARGKIINIGRGKQISINQLIQTIMKFMNYNGQIEYTKPRPGDVRKYCADVSLARSLIGFKPKASLKEDLRRTVKWYVEKFGTTVQSKN